MKAKEKETLKTHSVPELKAELAKVREQRFRLKFKHGVSPLNNPAELKKLRRHSARLETWIREKELAEKTAKAR